MRRERLGVLIDERVVIQERIAIGGASRLVRRQFVVLLDRVELGVLVERLPLFRRLRRVCRLWLGRGLRRDLAFARHLRSAPDWAERFAFGALDICRIGAAPAFQVEVLTDGVIE
jgi:hypothetical protein